MTVRTSTHQARSLEGLRDAARACLDARRRDELATDAASAVPRLVPGASAGAVALLDADGAATLTASGGVPDGRWPHGLTGLPGHAVVAEGDTWVAPDDRACDGPLPPGWRLPALATPLRAGGRLLGVLYAFDSCEGLDRDARPVLELLAVSLAAGLERCEALAEVQQADNRLARMMSITAEIAQRLDFSKIAQHIVDGLTAVTDFRCATVTLRDGDTCRRLAASGLEYPRIGLTTPLDRWMSLLQPSWRVGEISYLIPPEGIAEWADIPDLPPSDDPEVWTAAHGLVVVLQDPDGEILGFLSVDEPRSRRLPDRRTVESLELFARQVEVALVNARLYSALRQAAERDSLTGLRNRRACWADLDQTVPAASERAPVAIAVVDIDNFKHVNDSRGHAVGDRTLRLVADRLRERVRATDRVYRIGGEEFLVVLPGAGEDLAAAVLRRVAAHVGANPGDLPAVTISAGVAEAPRDGASADALFGVADSALYEAKRQGRDRVVTAADLPALT